MGLRSKNWLYHIVWQTARAMLNVIYRADIEGSQYVPKGGAFILASNHVSHFDPPMVGCCVPREICFFARKTLFKPGIVDKALRKLNSIPIDRDGTSDVKAFKDVFNALKGGNGLVVFPEGTRSPDGKIQDAKKGIGMMACRTGVTIMPARINGTYEAFGKDDKIPDWKPSITVVVGPPMEPSEYDPGKQDEDRYQVAADRILNRIKELEAPKYEI